MTLGQRIQELRKQNNLSQEAFGEKLGVSRQAVSRWEMDGAVPEVDKLITMSKLFGVSLNDLLQVEGPDGARTEIVLAPSRGWKLGILALALLTVLSLAGGGWLGWRMSALERETAAFSAEAGSAEAGGLDLSVPLLADVEYWVNRDPGAGEVTINFTLTVFQQVEDLEITLQAANDGGEIYQTDMTCAGGTIYGGALVIPDPMGSSLTVSAVFRDGMGTYTQGLYKLSGVYSTSNSYNWEALWDKTN